jgi:hypothetical protein
MYQGVFILISNYKLQITGYKLKNKMNNESGLAKLCSEK